MNVKLEAEAEDLKEKLSVITHAFNKIDQESSKYYEVGILNFTNHNILRTKSDSKSSGEVECTN